MLDIAEVEKGLNEYRKSLLCEEVAEAAILSELLESMGDDVQALAEFAERMASLEQDDSEC